MSDADELQRKPNRMNNADTTPQNTTNHANEYEINNYKT